LEATSRDDDEDGFSEAPSEKPFFSLSPAPLGRWPPRFRLANDGHQRELGRMPGRRPAHPSPFLHLDFSNPILDRPDLFRLLRHSSSSPFASYAIILVHGSSRR